MNAPLSPLARKLRLKPNMPGTLLMAFVPSLASLKAQVPRLLRAAVPEADIWLAYPKLTSAKASDLNRDTIRAYVEQLGWHTVSIIAVDETWSALRIRPNA